MGSGKKLIVIWVSEAGDSLCESHSSLSSSRLREFVALLIKRMLELQARRPVWQLSVAGDPEQPHCSCSLSNTFGFLFEV